MKLQTALENLEFFAYHGLYPEEREKGGFFKVDIWIDEEVPDNKDLTDLSNLINYEQLYTIVQEEMHVRRNFIEDLAKTILQRISHFLLEREVIVTVKVTKQNPAGKFGSGSASVTLQG
ncbi:MAG: dihydroneopterin aldolase [Bacteroidota bacterium]|nr:dihydroneopterin aldolase [Bacteroidota bacterium]